MGKLAVNGGRKLRNTPFQSWPIWDDSDCRALVDVCNSGQWWSVGGTKVKEFEQKFAEYQDCKVGRVRPQRHAGPAGRSEGARHRLRDEVIVTPYMFIASASGCPAVPSALDKCARVCYTEITMSCVSYLIVHGGNHKWGWRHSR